VELLLDNGYFTLTRDSSSRIVRLTRSTRAYPSVEVIEQVHQEIVEACRRLPRGQRLLVDVREGPMRNDEAFEAVLARYRPQVFQPFQCIAIVVKFAVGRLQVLRYGRESGGTPEVFQDEAAALEYLRAP
jgi:hypothetical protein